ncbi:unnamed protein product [Ectocarpus sp. CCAP 1310/34]|nr:unnamed protein product [Ectocarpus sp. CCAP 1310/34]
MRFATAVPVLVALLGQSSSVQGRHVAHSASRVAVAGRKPQQQQPNGASRQQLAQLQRPSQVRGGATLSATVVTVGATGEDRLTRMRGGRTSDTVVLVEALVETALESGLIVGFVGAAEYLAARYLSDTKFSEVARLALWTAAVFVSGAATAGPKKWLEKSQLFNIDVPIGKDWYTNLRKPRWNPPNWVFPIMWIPLKILQVFACYEMWDKLETRSCIALPVVVYTVYKSLGDVWNKVFFERRRLKIGTVVISLYYLTLLAGIKVFFDVSDRAGYLFAPTAAWVTIATCLQWSTWLLNRDTKK